MAKDPAEKKPAQPQQHQAQQQQHHHEPKAAAPAKGGKGHAPMPDGCHSWGCKAKAHRFNFCDEHYEQFKFGLIKKTGEPVPDHEKKLEHYLAFTKKRDARKVA